MSDNKTTVYNAKIDLFCQNMKRMLDDLHNLYPNDMTLNMCITMFNQLYGYFKESIVKQFMEIIAPFSEKILNRDESFFLYEAHENFSQDKWMMSEIEKIRKIWVDPETSAETKEALWKYMTTFVKIGKSLKMC